MNYDRYNKLDRFYHLLWFTIKIAAIGVFTYYAAQIFYGCITLEWL